jgi:hypothetical protein
MKNCLLFACLALTSWLHAFDVPLIVDKSQSRIEYTVKATMDTFTGTLSAYDLDLYHDPAALTKITRAELHFRFMDLTSANEKRDRHMRQWQATGQFPECIFTLTALEPGESAGRFTARGQFIFHGVARDLVFPVSLSTEENNLLVIDGEARIDTRDFNLPVIRKWSVIKVDPLVVVKLHLKARAAK